MPRYALNKMPTTVKKWYFELLREGYEGAAAARVGLQRDTDTRVPDGPDARGYGKPAG